MSPDAERASAIVDRLNDAYPNARYYLHFSSPLELVIAAILSAQTRDELVNSVTAELFQKYPAAESYATAPLEQLEEDLKRVNFRRRKAKSIQEACRTIAGEHQGRVPDTLAELTELAGIGRKTAHAILINAFDKVEGIVVDTHVIRLSKRLGFTNEDDPDRIEEDLKGLIPKGEWKRITWLMKDHGRAVCTPKSPKCSECVVNELCPQIGV